MNNVDRAAAGAITSGIAFNSREIR